MKYARFKCVVILLSAFILAVYGFDWIPALRVGVSSRVSVFSLWNYTGVHCDKGNVLYRHSFIDTITTLKSCIKIINVLLFVSYPDYNAFRMKLHPPFGDLSLESLLSKKPAFAGIWKPSAKISINLSDHHLINTDNFEFIWLNAAENVMHAGMYYNPLDANSPQFSFSINGVNYTAGGNSHVLSDDDVKYLEIGITIFDSRSGCAALKNKIDNNSLANQCRGPNVTVQANETRIPAGGQAAILCTIDSPLGILSLNWTLNDTEIDLHCTKYEGMILGTHILQINDFQSGDSGIYICFAATAMGTNQSGEIEIKMIGQPTSTPPPTTSTSPTSTTPPTTSISSTRSTTTVKSMCPCDCDCDCKNRIDYCAAQNLTTHTMEEWRVILKSVLDEIKKNLTVNKTNLSATIRRRSSAPDGRQSSKSMGIFAILLITLVVGTVIFIDITAFYRCIAAIRD